jgi:Retroviral aspartyl protease.
VGSFKVKAKVRAVEGSKSIEVELLVDSGSTYTVLPQSVLNDLGVIPKSDVKLKIADGSTIVRKKGEVVLEIDGNSVTTQVVFGNEGVYLLGSVTMEEMALTPDLINKKLVPVEAYMMLV